jgi:diguanylate cyclase
MDFFKSRLTAALALATLLIASLAAWVLLDLAAAAFLALVLCAAALEARRQHRVDRFARSLKRARVRLRSAHDALRRHAYADALTGLPNRLFFEDYLKRAAAQVARLAVLHIDLDRFRPINDSYGRAAGDAVLKEVGSRLGRVAGNDHLVARAGGDSFLLLMPGEAASAAREALAQQLIQALEQPFEVQGQPMAVSASIGIALFPEHGQPDHLVAHADTAMHAAKRQGGGRHALYEPRMEGEAQQQLSLVNDLHQAIDRGQLSLHYQPKIDGQRGQIRGAEALLRWRHPERGFVSPGVFIPLAERFGLIDSLGNWVIDEACRQMQAWADGGVRMRVAINVSAQQLRQGDLVARIGQALDRYQVEASQLLCEITESVAMDDIQSTQQTFQGLQRIGVYLSIDDFGTGYSSLAYLRQLPAKQIKIDRSFVSDLEASRDARAIVDAVIRLAHALGLRVVAEGVETAGQRDVLLELGCDELQGYFFAKPMPADALSDWAGGRKPAGSVDFSPSIIEEPTPA